MQLRGDYNSTSAVNCAAKTIVTITAPPAAAASASALHLGSSGRPSSVSTLTLASVPQSMLLEATRSASVSAANTPLAPAAKHTSFALTPSAMGPSSSSGSGHHVSFMPLPIPLPMMGIKQRLRDSNSSLSSPTATTTTATGAAATSSAPSLIEVAEEVAAAHQHAALELRQSVQSQITTLEDVDDVQRSDDNDDDDDSGSESESVGMALVQTTPQLECRRTEMASSSSSGSVK
ncbi:hypothetical protein KR215_010847 [Drosophila sulfurigaster]|nr:hypothetical protein KR215_010847 [Drosophila sulfurigaster]